MGIGPGLFRDVDDPHEGVGRRGQAVHDFLVRHHHQLTPLDGLGNGQRGVGGTRVGRAPVEAADPPRAGHIGYVEDDEAAVPIAGVQPVAEPKRMVAAVPDALPRRGFAARGPLSGHPPPRHLLGPGRVLHVQDHHDVADVALHLRREIGVFAVEIEAVNAGARGPVEADLAGTGLVGHVVDLESALKAVLRHAGVAFVVHQHDVAVDPDLVRMGPVGDLDVRDHLEVPGVGNVHDGRAVGRFQVSDVGVVPLHHDLPAARNVDVPQLPETFAGAVGFVLCHYQPPLGVQCPVPPGASAAGRQL